MSTQHDPGSQRKPSGVDQHHKHLVLKLHLYQRKCHNHRRQTTLAIIATKTIELVSQLNFGLQKPPCSSIHLERYGMIALSQKGILAFKLSSHKVQSVWQQLQSTYLSQVHWTLSVSVPSFTRNCTNPKNVSHTWPACDTTKLFKLQSKKHENKLATKFPVSFKIQFKTVSTSYTVQVVSNDSLHVPIKRTHNCSSNQHPWLPDASDKSNQRSQTGKHSSLRCQLTVSTPSSTVPSVPWRFLTLSLSLSTLVPTLPGKHQCFRLQSQGHQSVQTSVKLHCSCTLLNLRCSIIHALHYTCGN